MLMRKLFLTLLLFISVVACDDAYKSSIPDVAFELSYNVAVFPSITQPGYFVKVEKNTHGIPVGYAGIILGKSVFSQFGDNNYIAFDAACPVEASRSVSINVQEDGFGNAVCPSCGTKYALSSGGVPEGEGTEYLKRYNVTVNGSTLLARN